MTKNFNLLTNLKAVMTTFFNAVHLNEQRPFADRFSHESHLVKPFMAGGGLEDMAAFTGADLAERYRDATIHMLNINAAVKERIDQSYRMAVETTMAFFAEYEAGFKQDGRMTVISGDFGEQPIVICPFRLGELRYDEHFDRIRARLHFGSDTASSLNANQEWVAKLFIMTDGKWIISDLRPYGFMNSGSEMLPFVKPATHKVGDATYTSTIEKRAELTQRWEAEDAAMRAGGKTPTPLDWEALRESVEKDGSVRHVSLMATMPRQDPPRVMTGLTEGIMPSRESPFSMREIRGMAEGNFMSPITPAALRSEPMVSDVTASIRNSMGTMKANEWPKGADGRALPSHDAATGIVGPGPGEEGYDPVKHDQERVASGLTPLYHNVGPTAAESGLVFREEGTVKLTGAMLAQKHLGAERDRFSAVTKHVKEAPAGLDFDKTERPDGK